MDLFGQSDPLGSDGYIPGAWDHLRYAYLDGSLNEEAYEALLQLAPKQQYGVFIKFPGNEAPNEYAFEDSEHRDRFLSSMGSSLQGVQVDLVTRRISIYATEWQYEKPKEAE